MKLQILQVLLRSLNSFILSISRKIETNLDQLKTREDTTLLTQTVEATKADPKKVGGTIDKSLRRPAKKTIFSRLLIGLKKGYNTPTLPENILKFQSLIYIRILRVLGGIGFLFKFSKRSFYIKNKLFKVRNQLVWFKNNMFDINIYFLESKNFIFK